MPDTDQTGAKGFASLTELRGEHLKKMGAVQGKTADAELVGQVREFVNRACLTGKLLDSPHDRDAAQSILDYWSAWLLTTGDASSRGSAPAVLDEFDRANAPDLSEAGNPYKGLNPFTEDDASRLVGRDEAVNSLFQKVRELPAVMVHGSLGCGKSSLVLAGVVPRLRTWFNIEVKKEPAVIVMTPGADPLESLLRALYRAAGPRTLPNLDRWFAQQRKELENSPQSFGKVLTKVFFGRPVIIVVDQFDEVFSLGSDSNRGERLASALMSAAQSANRFCKTILIVREEFAARALQLQALKSIADNAESRFTPPPLTPAEVKRIIGAGADSIGLKFDDGIVEDLATEAAGSVAALPTLQFTLRKLWDQRERNRVTWEAYHKVGRPREAVKRAADAVFDSLDPADQTIAESIFLELVRPAIGDSAHGDDFERRRARREILSRLGPPQQVAGVLERFVDEGLIRLTRGADPDEDSFEVPHEALVYYWPRLSEWLAQKREQSKKELQLRATAQLWQESGKQRGYLLTGEALEEAKPYRGASPELGELVEASERASEEARRAIEEEARTGRTRRKLVGITILAILATSVACISVLLWRNAEKSRSLERERSVLEKVKMQKELQELRASQSLTAANRKIDVLQNLAKPTVAGGDSAATEVVSQQAADAYGNAPAATDPSAQPQPQAGYIWVGQNTPGDTNIQDATTSKAVLPTTAVKDGHYKVDKHLVLRADKPTNPDYVQAQGLGVVPAGTVVTATGAAVPYNRPATATRPATIQYWLPVETQPSTQPIVYFQYANAQADAAQKISRAIQGKGYRVPLGWLQNTDLAKGVNEVRYYYPADQAAAVTLAGDVTSALKSLGYALPPTKAVLLPAQKWNYPGVLELWLDPSKS